MCQKPLELGMSSALTVLDAAGWILVFWLVINMKLIFIDIIINLVSYGFYSPLFTGTSVILFLC